MSAFTLALRSALGGETVTGVVSFVGEDASGSFGIKAGHARFMTALVFGLARFRVGEGDWEYLALPGALLYFRDDVLRLATRRYLRGSDYNTISQALTDTLLAEERKLRTSHESIRALETAMRRRLWQTGPTP